MSQPRKTLIAGNWKLHKTISEATKVARDIAAGAGSVESRAELVVAPVFTALAGAGQVLQGSPVSLAAQDVYWQSSGAFTGEVSAPLLKDVGCSYCIIGHSERRAMFGDDDAAIGRKLGALLKEGIAPIACVGETLEHREAGRTLEVVLGQLRGVLAGFQASELAALVIAYEPVWAIGTGRTASPADAQEVHAALRGELATLLDSDTAEATRILYGGSVKPGNASTLLNQPDIDGALVGGASLEADSFLSIAAAAPA